MTAYRSLPGPAISMLNNAEKKTELIRETRDRKPMGRLTTKENEKKGGGLDKVRDKNLG